MVVPTRRFWGLVALGVPLALAGAALPGLDRLVLPYNLGLLALLGLSRFRVPAVKHLKATRAYDRVLSVNAWNTISITLTNESPFRAVGRARESLSQRLQSKGADFALDLPAGTSKTVTYEVKPTERGREPFHATYLRLRAPLGLAEVQVAIENPDEARVYPNLKAMREFDLLNQRGRLALLGIRRTRYRGMGSDFESMREYADDDYRRIDWKSTARRGKLVVRDYEQERNQTVFIVLDAGRHMLAEAAGRKKLDHVLDTLLMVLQAANSAGDQVGLLVYGERVHQYVAPRRGRAAISAIIEAVHDLQARPTQPNHAAAMAEFASKWKRRALVIWFTDAEDEAEASAILRAAAPLRQRHLWFLARVMDPRLRELEHRPLQREEDLLRLASLTWYQAERKRAEIQLVGSGMRNLEAEPDQLAATLVNAYWQVKATGGL